MSATVAKLVLPASKKLAFTQVSHVAPTHRLLGHDSSASQDARCAVNGCAARVP